MTLTNGDENMSEKKMMMQATEIDNEGVWHWDGKEIPLLGNFMPVPDTVRKEFDPKRQEILMIVDVGDWLEICPECGEEAKGIILVTAHTKIYPAHCCDMMVWMTDKATKRDYNEIYQT